MAKHRRGRRSRKVQADFRPSMRRHQSAVRSTLWGVGYLSLVIGIFVLVYLVRFIALKPRPQADHAQAVPPENQTQTETDLSKLKALFTVRDDTQRSSEAMDRALRQEQLAVAQYLVKTLPESANALFIMAMAYQEQGDSVHASQYLEQCLQRQPGRADALDQLGRIAQQAGDHDRAVTFFQQALARDPNLIGGHYRLAEALKFQGNPRQALAELARHAKQQPQAPDGYALQGEIHLQLQEYEQAKQNYEQAIKLNPQLARPYFGLATACARLGLKAEAGDFRRKFQEVEKQAQDLGRQRRADFDPLAVTRTSVAHTHTDAGRIYHAEQREALARALWERACALDHQDVTCRFSLADLHLRAGRTSAALALYQQVVAIQPENGPAYFFIGHIQEKHGNLDAAERAYQKVVEVSPQRPEGYLTLIRFYQETRPDLPRAKTLTQALIKLVPTASNYALLARICHQLKENAPALAAINKALEMAPHNVQYRTLCQEIQETQ